MDEHSAREALLTAAELERDAVASYYAAIAAIAERVKAGAPLPECLRAKDEE
jgi:hypothetical protein